VFPGECHRCHVFLAVIQSMVPKAKICDSRVSMPLGNIGLVASGIDVILTATAAGSDAHATAIVVSAD